MSTCNQEGDRIDKGMTMMTTKVTLNFATMATVIAAIKGGKPRQKMPNEWAVHQREAIEVGDGQRLENGVASQWHPSCTASGNNRSRVDKFNLRV